MTTDPVFTHHGAWYFWDETWTQFLGPFDSEEKARKSLEQYAKYLSGEDFENVDAEWHDGETLL